MKILFLSPYPHGAAPSQRFRFEQYFDSLKEAGIEYRQYGFWDDATWKILYSEGKLLRKVRGLLSGYIRRFSQIICSGRYDYVFIHREADPLGWFFFPFLLKKVLRKRIIYDFDDAIWIPNSSESNKSFMHLKNWKNTPYLCKLAHRVSAGNRYLCTFASQFNTDVRHNPTTIDTIHLHNKIKVHDSDGFVIGWTGTHSTINYLYDLIPMLEKLHSEYPFTLAVICDREPDRSLPGLKFIPWNKTTEIEDLLVMNVGLMPLREDAWSSGKCGFKALQYMSLGIPALVSPVGVNTDIVDDGVNGFVCDTEEEWLNALRKLIRDRALLIKLSSATRKKIEDRFSVVSNTPNFLSLFRD